MEELRRTQGMKALAFAFLVALLKRWPAYALRFVVLDGLFVLLDGVFGPLVNQRTDLAGLL